MIKCYVSQIQALASQLTDLWNLMDTSADERQLFDHVTCNISSTLDEVTAPGALDIDLIEQVRRFSSQSAPRRIA
jgi:protein regulator of cytokinesis 1